MSDDRYQQDFLWFSYFGITKTEANADLSAAMRQCIRRAYLDLSRRVPYTYSIEKLKEMPEEEDREAYVKRKNDFKKAVEDYLMTQIGRLLENPKLDFDGWHEKLCSPHETESIMEIAARHKGLLSKEFSVGLAQKWVNMTLKNMLVMGLWEKPLSARKKDLHIPIDSYIISAARVDLRKPIFEGEPTGLGVKVKIGKWSKIATYEQYMKFQNAVRDALDGVSPIDWEGPAWIAQAKEEKQKEEKKELGR